MGLPAGSTLVINLDGHESVEGLDWVSGDNCSTAESNNLPSNIGVETAPFFPALKFDHSPSHQDLPEPLDDFWGLRDVFYACPQHPLPAGLQIRQHCDSGHMVDMKLPSPLKR